MVDVNNDALMRHSKALADECLEIADLMATHADRLALRRKALRTISIVIGIAAILVGYVPAISQLVGATISQLMPALAALTLIAGASIYLFAESDPPERFRDYALYIRYYHQRISEIITYKDKKVLDAQLKEINILAQQNVRDARAKWPTLLSSVSSIKLEAL